MGRVSGRKVIKYEPKTGQMLIAHMARGLSFESFAGVISITEAELKDMLQRYPDFKRSFEIASQKSRLFWENVGICVTLGIKEMKQPDGSTFRLGTLNASTWQFVMKNRFGWSGDQDDDRNKDQTIKIKLPDELKKKQPKK